MLYYNSVNTSGSQMFGQFFAKTECGMGPKNGACRHLALILRLKVEKQNTFIIIVIQV
jgi:hypothetical protein